VGEFDEAFRRIEAVARENEVLKATLARQDRELDHLRLGVGHVSALIRMATLLRHYQRAGSAEALVSALVELGYYDRDTYGPDGPSGDLHRRALGERYVEQLGLSDD
jgi:hypothetical protein